MRLPRRSEKEKSEASPEDTQEMFTAGASLPDDPEETREYEAVVEAAPVADDLEPDEGIEPGEEIKPDEAEFSDEEFDDEEIEAIEEESWDGDEDEAWEEEPGPPEEPGEEEPGPPEATGTSRTGDLKVWFTEFRGRIRSIGTGLLKRIGAIRLPRHEIDGQKALLAGAIIVVALLVGSAGYVLGKGSGKDLDSARLEGEFAGKRAGAIAGATKGYATGFKKGRDVAFRKSYSASYRRNYIRAYDGAGVDPPKAKDIEVPEP